MGFVAGLPVGLSFIGGARSEPAMIGYAFAFERATEHRGVPRLIQTLEE
jgi:amidase